MVLLVAARCLDCSQGFVKAAIGGAGAVKHAPGSPLEVSKFGSGAMCIEVIKPSCHLESIEFVQRQGMEPRTAESVEEFVMQDLSPLPNPVRLRSAAA